MLIVNTHITLCAGPYSKPLRRLIYLVFHTTLCDGYLLFPLSRLGNRGTKRLNNLVNVTELANDKARI